MIVYLARDIQAFVMYCVNGESGSSLLIESTDSMIYCIYIARDNKWYFNIKVDCRNYRIAGFVRGRKLSRIA